MPPETGSDRPYRPVGLFLTDRTTKASLLEGFAETQNVNASGFRRTLDAIDQRVTLISHQSALSMHDFVELTALYNNAAYILLYLDANSAHIKVDFLQHFRKAFSAPRPRNDRLVTLIDNLTVDSQELEVSKDAFLEFFKQEIKTEQKHESDAVANMRRRGAVWRESLDREKSDFLTRLGVDAGSNRPDAALYALLAGLNSNDVRRRIGVAWRDICERHNSELCGLIDELVSVRQKSANAMGASSVTERTLRQSQLDIPTVRNFLDCSLQMARAEHEELELELSQCYGPGGVLAHFPSHVALARESEGPTVVPLDQCINFALKIAHDHFGLDASRVASAPDHMITYDISRQGKRIGRINFDLWGENLRRVANTTRGLRNRANWTDIIQEPVAHISCRFKRRPGQNPSINFQNAHSLLHEFGHAINHLLVTPRLPNVSGLEYLPLERIEILSMWFERWVFHSAFEAALSIRTDEPVDLQTAREIKRLEYVRTHLERNVLAMLDFELHQGAASISEVYADIDQRYDIKELCPFSDVLPCFFWPILMERPGGYFCYLWAAASSAERFEATEKRTHGIVDSSVSFALEFRDCFEFDAPSVKPNIAAIYQFYKKQDGTIDRKMLYD